MRISMMVMPHATDSLDAVIAAIAQAADAGVAESGCRSRPRWPGRHPGMR